MTRSTTIAIWFCGGGWLTAAVVASANRVGGVAGELELHLPLRDDLGLRAAAQDRGGLRDVATADHGGRQSVLVLPPRRGRRPPADSKRVGRALRELRSASVPTGDRRRRERGVDGGTIAEITGRSSSRAVCPITSSRRCWPVARCCSSADVLIDEAAQVLVGGTDHAVLHVLLRHRDRIERLLARRPSSSADTGGARPRCDRARSSRSARRGAGAG